jgi:phosphoglycolate phosphatase-like HAD superfamily hydrolase
VRTPVLIFDFDGTIADTFSPTIDILSSDYRQWGDRFHRQHTVNQLRSLPIKDIVTTIPGGWWKFAWLLLKAKRYIRRHTDQIKAYPGIVYTLRTLADQGFPLLIVTSNHPRNVQNFLHRYNLDQVFLDIRPTNGLWRKATTLKRVLRDFQLRPQDVFYIGDEIRDIQACRQLAIPIISVTYGFNSAPGLKKFHPTHLIKKPTQLLQLLAAASQS